MTALRSVADYAERLAGLMPRGRAWPEAGGRIWSGLMAALAPEFRRADKRLLALMDEADPRTTNEGLTDWERVLGLPDDCAPAGASFEERRNAVITQLRALGGATPAYFKGLCAELGYAVEIFEHRPIVCGETQLGDGATTGSPLIRFSWTVVIPGPAVSWFQTGDADSRVGETPMAVYSAEGAGQRARWFRLGDENSRVGETPMISVARLCALECLITRLAPAHTVVTFRYGGETDLVFPTRSITWFRCGHPDTVVGQTPMAKLNIDQSCAAA